MTLKASGHIAVGYTHPKTGRTEIVHEQKNLILFEGADIMSLLLKGDPAYKINYMYFQYQNISGSVTAPTALTRADGRSAFDGITGAAPNPYDWIRFPILTDGLIGSYPSGTTDYSGNTVTFTGTSAASSTQTGESQNANYFGAPGGPDPASKVYAAALVAAPVAGDSTQDKIFSRVILDTPFTMVSGVHMSLFWTIRFQ
jgi:hypothetical protein